MSFEYLILIPAVAVQPCRCCLLWWINAGAEAGNIIAKQPAGGD